MKNQPMKTRSLSADVLYGLTWYKIDFESKSPYLNFLMNVQITVDGRNHFLDDIKLQETHPNLYTMIEQKIKDVSEVFWMENRENQKKTFSRLPNMSSNDFVNDFFDTIKSFR